MPAAKRRKLKAERASAAIKGAPLGSGPAPTHLGFLTEKDDEERQLESLLFGVPYAGPSSSSSKKKTKAEKDVSSTVNAGSSGLEHMLDKDLFFIDDALPEDGPTQPAILDFGNNSSFTLDVDGGDEETPPVDDKEPQTTNNFADAIGSLQISKKKAAWVDPADARINVSLVNDTRLRKLRDAPSEDVISAQTYENKLRRQYEKINPVPEWATNARAKLHSRGSKRRRSSVSSSQSYSDDEDDEAAQLDGLLRSTDGVLSSSRSTSLPSGELQISRLRDANQAGSSEGAISSIQFHPSHTVPVMLTAGADRRLRLFNVDGLTNPLLQTLHIPDLPLPTAQFSPRGSSILLTSTRPFFYTYDLQSGRAVKSPQRLAQGTSLGATGGAAEDRAMDIAKFSPEGDLVAVGGRRGHIHLLDWSEGSGGSQVVGTLKMNSSVKDVCWVPGSGGRRELLTMGADAEVYLWDVGEQRCVSRWKDEGALGPKILEAARGGSYYAIGTGTGIVNVYGSNVASIPAPSPLGIHSVHKPLKAITNLTTAITTVRFDRSAQIMAIASKSKKDQLRMVHLPSLTTFSNWPTSGTPLGTVTAMDFSAGSEYAAIGNTRGKVLLYNLRHFVKA